MTENEVINRFNDGEKVRLTRGVWKFPKRDGKFAQSVEEIEKFYDSMCVVDNCISEGGIIDLFGATFCDMF